MERVEGKSAWAKEGNQNRLSFEDFLLKPSFVRLFVGLFVFSKGKARSAVEESEPFLSCLEDNKWAWLWAWSSTDAVVCEAYLKCRLKDSKAEVSGL